MNRIVVVSGLAGASATNSTFRGSRNFEAPSSWVELASEEHLDQQELFEAPLFNAHSLRMTSMTESEMMTQSQIEYIKVLSAITNLFSFHKNNDPADEFPHDADFNFLTSSFEKNIFTIEESATHM